MSKVKDCVAAFYDPTTKKHDIPKIKSCLNNKINTYFSSCDKFHKEVSDAIRDATLPMIDFKLTDIEGKLNKILESNKFSLNVFLCDLVLSIVVGPLLGTISGKLFMTGVEGISTLRSGFSDFGKKSLGKAITNPGGISAETKEALASIGIKTIHKTRGEIDLGTFKDSKRLIQTLNYKDFSTGVVVDSFEVMYDKILHISDSESIKTSSKMAFDASTSTDSEPTPLEFVANKARKYYHYQKRLNDVCKFIFLFMVENVKDVEHLKLSQDIIDSLNATFDDLNESTEDNYIEINNLTKIILLTFYFGEPAEWATDQESIRMGKGYLKSKAHEVVNNNQYGGMPTKAIVYPYTIKFPKELKQQLIKNILVPNEKKSFLKFYQEKKEGQLKRNKGAGIDQKKYGDYYGINDLNKIDVNDIYSEYYTAEETAFRQLQKFAEAVYEESKQKNGNFLEMLSSRGLLAPS